MQPESLNRTVALRLVEASGTFSIGALCVERLGFGTVQLTGPGIWHPPRDHGEAIHGLRSAVELGVDLIDTVCRRALRALRSTYTRVRQWG
jgi:hypothetical protein